MKSLHPGLWERVWHRVLLLQPLWYVLLALPPKCWKYSPTPLCLSVNHTLFFKISKQASKQTNKLRPRSLFALSWEANNVKWPSFFCGWIPTKEVGRKVTGQSFWKKNPFLVFLSLKTNKHPQKNQNYNLQLSSLLFFYYNPLFKHVLWKGWIIYSHMQGFHGGDYFSAKTIPQEQASRVLMSVIGQELIWSSWLSIKSEG